MKIPLVLIVGRPNVGKSTLYNRLTKSRDAIVDDVSGVTRDRIYGEVEWNGKRFRLIDTGGYVPESEDRFEAAIREQIDIALAEADAFLFVADAKSGLSPVDKEIANMLRNSLKPVFLLVNKVDHPKHEMEKNEFYSLGFERLYDVSALSGRNLGDLLDDLLNNLTFSDSEIEEDERLRIAILGRPNVGKSSLVNALSGFDRSIVTEIPGTTRDSIDSVIKYYGEDIVLVDTAGLRKKARVKENIEFYSNVRTYQALGSCDVSIILIDAQYGLENQEKKILNEAVRRRKGIILAVNKWDLIDKDNNTAVSYEKRIKAELGNIDYLPVIFISALTKQRIFKLLELSKSIQLERRKKIPTNELNEKLLGEIQKMPPPATSSGKEIKIKYVSQVGSNYPVFLFFAGNAKLMPDHYIRFLEKKIRSLFGFKGVPFTISFREK